MTEAQKERIVAAAKSAVAVLRSSNHQCKPCHDCGGCAADDAIIHSLIRAVKSAEPHTATVAISIPLGADPHHWTDSAWSNATFVNVERLTINGKPVNLEDYR